MQCSATDAASFACLRRLPTELRIEIWRLAIPRRVLWLGSELMFIQRPPHRRPRIDQLCCEARSAVEMYGMYLKLNIFMCNPSRALIRPTWFDLLTVSIFIQASATDTERLLGIKCDVYIGGQAIHFQYGLRELIGHKLFDSLRPHPNVSVQVPTWSLAQAVDCQGLALMSGLGRCMPNVSWGYS
jgi:hypothetical protein